LCEEMSRGDEDLVNTHKRLTSLCHDVTADERDLLGALCHCDSVFCGDIGTV